ncbi:type III-A CRISPR-associated RAMP protein Csm5 [Myroides odoratimimus]|uniref:type III-A CRISPR-associated RAMP protein Csm5 n=1 Tax=Myroides odoratimimus TaxID=76832 RepID=UPI00103D3D44|nr:type III-A CRISPR-associated RAMP protein Csm5 [Myroides odoratimimus]MCO7724395.1 type III-A CRISPR-associated RAMP protein Csm5 [Myroides odoratimimus]MCS7473034.1 type III-A CRISPR-associated RAMP protein Csm5 [Myroides odoratimimus]MDM1035686.1 type III-A CRISPR-associated RAMP protein Csm5 [Myroides odoratimimus]MDM1414879.1 type III-A CRISPR-associated RAMP protein Csm5 [Myroides odoratimimus]MDM1447393.1 type III-A CRISPR-associated RAMP protein Csm5 [Myroides odoratimimus]
MVNKTILNTRYNLNLEVISPVAINDGGTLSPLSDYFVSAGELHYVDEEAFQKLLAEDESIANRYEQLLVKTPKDGADDFLHKVIQSEAKLSRISNGNKVPFYGGKTLGFKTIIKSNGKAYIPGSSLKGAIKNAYLFYWLEKEGQEELKQFVKKFIALKNKKEKEDEIKCFVDDVQKKAFGIKEGYLYQPSSNISLSDSTVLEFVDIAVANVTKQSLKEKVEDWDLHTQEYIREGATVSFVLSINKTDEDWSKFDSFNPFVILMQESKNDLTALFEVLNYYHNSLQQFRDNGFDVEKTVVDVSSDEAILYLGSNKGIYKTTVLLAVRHYCESNGLNFINEFGYFLQRTKKDHYRDFPNTISHINRQRMGMVKISNQQVGGKIYDEATLKSGNAIEGIIKKIDKPNSEVLVNVEGKEQVFAVGGAKAFLKERPNALQVGKKCVFYWRDNNYYFSK